MPEQSKFGSKVEDDDDEAVFTSSGSASRQRFQNERISSQDASDSGSELGMSKLKIGASRDTIKVGQIRVDESANRSAKFTRFDQFCLLSI